MPDGDPRTSEQVMNGLTAPDDTQPEGAAFPGTGGTDDFICQAICRKETMRLVR